MVSSWVGMWAQWIIQIFIPVLILHIYKNHQLQLFHAFVLSYRLFKMICYSITQLSHISTYFSLRTVCTAALNVLAYDLPTFLKKPTEFCFFSNNFYNASFELDPPWRAIIEHFLLYFRKIIIDVKLHWFHLSFYFSFFLLPLLFSFYLLNTFNVNK